MGGTPLNGSGYSNGYLASIRESCGGTDYEIRDAINDADGRFKSLYDQYYFEYRKAVKNRKSAGNQASPKTSSTASNNVLITKWYHPKSEPKQLYIVDFEYNGKKKTYQVYYPSGEVRDITNGKWKKARKSYDEDKVRYRNEKVLRRVFKKVYI